jgi:copper(I)-binding protein
MQTSFTRRHLIRSATASGLSLLLPAARSCQIPMGSFTIVHPWAFGTPAGADGEVYMGFIDVVKADRLIGASCAVAERVEMGGVANPRVDFEIREGVSSGFSDAGPYLKLVGLKMPLYVNGSYTIALEFEKVGLIEANLSVDMPRFR